MFADGVPYGNHLLTFCRNLVRRNPHDVEADEYVERLRANSDHLNMSVWFPTDNAEPCDPPSDMPGRGRRVTSTTGLLRRIELLARDLAKEAERDGAMNSDTALALANGIKGDIDRVIRTLSPSREPRARRTGRRG